MKIRDELNWAHAYRADRERANYKIGEQPARASRELAVRARRARRNFMRDKKYLARDMRRRRTRKKFAQF